MTITTIEPVQTAVAQLDERAACALTGQLQELLGASADLAERLEAVTAAASDLLVTAFDARVWVSMPTPLPTWADYCRVHLGMLALPPAATEALARQLRERGWSTRAIAAPLHWSEATVRRRTADVIPGEVIGADGRVYADASRPVEPVKAIEARKTDLALHSLAVAELDGLTGPELGKKRRWEHGKYSATLTRLHQQGKVVRLAERRGAHCVYVLPEHVAGRTDIPLGRRSPLPLGR